MYSCQECNWFDSHVCLHWVEVEPQILIKLKPNDFEDLANHGKSGSPKYFGGAPANLFEPQVLTASITRNVAWRKGIVNLAALANLRWVEKWKIERLARHFGVGITTTKVALRRIKRRI